MKLFNRTTRAAATFALLFTTASCGAQSAKPQAKAAPLRSDNIALMGGVMRVTPLFHASLMLEYRGKVIYVDPISAALLPKKADLVLITHSHPDHFDVKALEKVRHIGDGGFTAYVAPPETFKQLSLPVRGANPFFPLQNGEKKTIGKIFIQAVPAYNIVRGPKAGQKYHPKEKWNGYVLTIGGKKIYIAGDTEGTPEMKALKNIDVAFVPMNLPYTMTPQEAAAGVRAFHPRIVYPYHYRYPFDKPNTNPQQFAALLRGSGIQVRIHDWYPPDAVARALKK